MPYAVITAAAAILAVLLLAYWWVKTSNSFKRMQVKITEALSGVEVALAKRYDMLTKLLDVARGFAAHEKGLFAEVIQLRRGMPIAELNSASQQIDALASRINVVAEAYPQLRSGDVFVQLQSGIRDAEEHLQAARRLYNSNVTGFNTALRVFPASLVGKAMKLEEQAFFAAEEAKKADVAMQF